MHSICLHGLVLNYVVKYMDNFTLYFTFILPFLSVLLLFPSPYITHESMAYMELFQIHAKASQLHYRSAAMCLRRVGTIDISRSGNVPYRLCIGSENVA
jgi:hypothetical protein